MTIPRLLALIEATCGSLPQTDMHELRRTLLIGYNGLSEKLQQAASRNSKPTVKHFRLRSDIRRGLGQHPQPATSRHCVVVLSMAGVRALNAIFIAVTWQNEISA